MSADGTAVASAVTLDELVSQAPPPGAEKEAAGVGKRKRGAKGGGAAAAASPRDAKAEHKRARKERLALALANRAVRPKVDLVGATPAECQVWLAANPLDIALKTLRQYIPGITAIFWLPKGGSYAAFETEAALEYALGLKEVDADGSVTRIDRYSKPWLEEQGRKKGRKEEEEAAAAAADGTGDAAAAPGEAAPSVNLGVTPEGQAKGRRLKRQRREGVDVIPKDDATVGYTVVPKGHGLGDAHARHAGRPQAFLSNRPTFIAAAALKRRLIGLEAVQWVHAPRDKHFRKCGYEGARAAFRSAEAATDALSVVRYNVHGSDVFVRGRPRTGTGAEKAA